MADEKKETKQESYETLYEGDLDEKIATLNQALVATNRLKELAKQELERRANSRD